MQFRIALRHGLWLLLIGQLFLLGAGWVPTAPQAARAVVPAEPERSSGRLAVAGRPAGAIRSGSRSAASPRVGGVSPAAAANPVATYALRHPTAGQPVRGRSGRSVGGRTDAGAGRREGLDRTSGSPDPKAIPTPRAITNGEPLLLGLTDEPGHPYDRLLLDLSAPVRLIPQNTHTGRFLRIRVEPAVGKIGPGVVSEFRRYFDKFSFFRGPGFSEFLIYSRGHLGQPTLATSPTGLPRLVIPYKAPRQQPFPLGAGEEIRPGLWYHRDRPLTGRGPADVHLLRLDLRHRGIHLVPVQANEGVCQREVLSSMVKRYRAVAAINGAYFNLSDGDPLGTLIIHRRLISSPILDRSVFGLTRDGGVLFGSPEFIGVAQIGAIRFNIDAVNQPRHGNQVVIYTGEYSSTTHTTGPGREFVLVRGRVVGIAERNARIPPDGIVLSAGGTTGQRLSRVRLGDRIEVSYKVNPPWDEIEHAVAGGPRLVRDGEVAVNGRQEKFPDGITFGRHPRTAIGITDAGEILMAVVDGRSQQSAGMTLAELALYLKRLGVVQAMNLDGGGSSQMMIGSKVCNRPSDGRERPISNALLVTAE